MGDSVEYADAVIVGSGFGASVAAYRLADAGKSVVLMERGRPRDGGVAAVHLGPRADRAEAEVVAAVAESGPGWMANASAASARWPRSR